MPATKHTKGPWRVVTDDRRNDWGRNRPGTRTSVLLIAGPANERIVSTRGLSKPGRVEGQANARLIAAAHDMFEALKDIMALAEALPQRGVLIGAWERARAAIAKAEAA